MAWSHEIVGGLAVFRVEGPYTLDEATAAYAVLLDDQAFRPSMPLLVDGTRSVAKPSVQEMLASLNFAALQPHQFGKIAMAVSGSFHYGLARMFATYAELRSGVKIRIFKRVEEAREWIAEATE